MTTPEHRLQPHPELEQDLAQRLALIELCRTLISGNELPADQAATFNPNVLNFDKPEHFKGTVTKVKVPFVHDGEVEYQKIMIAQREGMPIEILISAEAYVFNYLLDPDKYVDAWQEDVDNRFYSEDEVLIHLTADYAYLDWLKYTGRCSWSFNEITLTLEELKKIEQGLKKSESL